MTSTSRPPLRTFGRRDFLARTGRGVGYLAASGVLAQFLAACEDGDTVAGGDLSLESIESAGGTVKILVWEGYENTEAFAAVEDDVAIEAAYLAANEDTITRTETAGAFDLITIYQGMIDPLLQLDRIQPIDTGLLVNFNKLFPSFQDSNALRRDGNLYGVPYTWGTMMMLYDSSAIDTPQTFEDLMSVDLRGRVGMPDDTYAVITTFARYAGFEDANSLTSEQLDEVMSLLSDFKPQLLSIAPNYGELTAMYQRNEIVASVPDWTPTAVAAQEAGIDVRSTIPEEGAFSFVDSWMRVTGAENAAAEYRLIDQSISAEAQTVVAGSTGLGIVNQDAVAQLDAETQEAWNYEQLAQNFEQAPLYDGAPIEADGDVTTFQQWTERWEAFKAQ